MCYFISVVTGEAFDTTQPVNCAVSNIICSIVYGSRFEYNDPEFILLVKRTSRIVRLGGSPSIQVLIATFWSIFTDSIIYFALHKALLCQLWQIFDMFPSLFKWTGDRNEIHKIYSANKKQNRAIFSRLKESLNPQMCRGFVDAFLVRKQNLEVGLSIIFQVGVLGCLTEAQGEIVHVPAQNCSCVFIELWNVSETSVDLQLN